MSAKTCLELWPGFDNSKATFNKDSQSKVILKEVASSLIKLALALNTFASSAGVTFIS